MPKPGVPSFHCSGLLLCQESLWTHRLDCGRMMGGKRGYHPGRTVSSGDHFQMQTPGWLKLWFWFVCSPPLDFNSSIWTMTNSYTESISFISTCTFVFSRAECKACEMSQYRTRANAHTYGIDSFYRQRQFSDLPDDRPFFCALRNLFLKVALTAVPPRFAPVTILPSEQFFACQWRDPIISTRMPPTGEFTSGWANWPQQVLGEVTTIFPFGPNTAMRTNTRPMPQASVARQRSTRSS